MNNNHQFWLLNYNYQVCWGEGEDFSSKCLKFTCRMRLRHRNHVPPTWTCQWRGEVSRILKEEEIVWRVLSAIWRSERHVQKRRWNNSIWFAKHSSILQCHVAIHWVLSIPRVSAHQFYNARDACGKQDIWKMLCICVINCKSTFL